jgi:hypothetical protein
LVGQAFSAKLFPYPGAYPLRAVPGEIQLVDRPFARLEGYPSLTDFMSAYTEALRVAPGLGRFPGLLADVIPFAEEGEFYMVDPARRYLPLHLPAQSAWQLVALSAGRAVMVFGEWDGTVFYPQSAVLERRIIELGASIPPEKTP